MFFFKYLDRQLILELVQSRLPDVDIKRHKYTLHEFQAHLQISMMNKIINMGYGILTWDLSIKTSVLQWEHKTGWYKCDAKKLLIF